MSDTPVPRRKLPPLPPGIKILTDEQSRALNQRHPFAAISVQNCVTCGGQKVFRWYDEAGQVAEYDCPCRSQYVLYRYLLHCGVMPRYQQLGWRDLAAMSEEAVQIAADYIERQDYYIRAGIGLLFTGPHGTGKTLLANLIVKGLIGQGADCFVTTASDMISAYTEGWRDKEANRWFHQRVSNVGVLLIDDLGSEHHSRVKSMSENMFENVIRGRVQRRQVTFVSTNMVDEEQRAILYGAPLLSLLSEVAIECPVPGSDFRKSDTLKARTQREMRDGVIRPVTIQ